MNKAVYQESSLYILILPAIYHKVDLPKLSVHIDVRNDMHRKASLCTNKQRPKLYIIKAKAKEGK